MDLPKSSFAESDLVLDKSSLVQHIKNELIDYIDHETDLEKLSMLLKLAVKKNVSAHGKRYTVSPEAVTEQLIKSLNNG